MKVTTKLPLLALGLLLVLSGCKKEDTTNPVVTLIGDATMTVSLGGTFTDPGATATDDTDGDLTASIEVSNPVDVNLARSYTVIYAAQDEAGNVGTANRTVNVVHDRSTYTGAFTTSHNCSQPYVSSSNPTFSEGAADNEVDISPFYFNGGTLTLTVNGSTATVKAGQSPNPVGAAVTGSGTMSDDGMTLTMEYTFTPNQGQPVTCTVTYSK